MTLKVFDESIKFKYSWRPYQERILKQMEKYINDKKIHIVAAPGSGKTILGLELVRFINKPVIIFAPTVTIKNQWVERFISHFTNYENTPDWISTDIYNLKTFNVVTYQALHYAYKKRNLKNEISDETDDFIQDNSEEKISTELIKQYDIVQELKSKGITTICLDEAHHLKSEWWSSLSKVINELEATNIIALTATPPYDSEFGEWKKYISLCGEIDAEITVPELVKANNLCPHQDYIFFNKPTQDEQKKINEYSLKLDEVIEGIKNNQEFAECVKSHRFIQDPYSYQEELLDNVEYYSSMIIFLNYKNANISKDNLSILGDIKTIPKLTNEWLEILLKNVIITDRKSYKDCAEPILQIEKELNDIGAIEKSSLSFSDNKTLQKYFLNSIGKLNSISEIYKIEQESLKENLRMVILTDFIRKEYIDNPEIEINKLGVLPIFMKLVKDYPDINMAILTGTLFVIPKSREENLYGLCYTHGISTDKLKFEKLKANENYSIVIVPNSIRNSVMNMISKLFSVGKINVIVGTKSLLGEGWDEPSINTLVLASFVGSFMLSNQMRGRAIRTNKDPNKTANIWHLVCATNEISNENVANADFEMLKRRFKSFVGISYNNNTVKNGIERLGSISEPFTDKKINSINKMMERKATDRHAMYDAWKDAVEAENENSMIGEMTNKIELDQPKEMKKSWFISKGIIVALAVFVAILLIMLMGISPFIFKIAEVILGSILIVKFIDIYKKSKSDNMLKLVGEVVLNSLYRHNFITTPRAKVRLKVEKTDPTHVSSYITGATLKESNLFVDSVEEVFSKTINQRYIIARLNKNLKQINDYYNVPTVLSTKKEMAETFSKYWKQKIGEHDLVYTRTADGRRMLLKARMKDISVKDRITKSQEMSKFR